MYRATLFKPPSLFHRLFFIVSYNFFIVIHFLSSNIYCALLLCFCSRIHRPIVPKYEDYLVHFPAIQSLKADFGVKKALVRTCTSIYKRYEPDFPQKAWTSILNVSSCDTLYPTSQLFFTLYGLVLFLSKEMIDFWKEYKPTFVLLFIIISQYLL